MPPKPPKGAQRRSGRRPHGPQGRPRSAQRRVQEAPDGVLEDIKNKTRFRSGKSELHTFVWVPFWGPKSIQTVFKTNRPKFEAGNVLKVEPKIKPDFKGPQGSKIMKKCWKNILKIKTKVWGTGTRHYGGHDDGHGGSRRCCHGGQSIQIVS